MSFEILKPEWGALRPIRGVLFDMDGLVVDTEKLFTRFWMEAALSFGFPMTREQALGMRGLSGPAGEARLQGYFGPRANYRQIRGARIVLMDAYIAENGVTPKPGIHELMAYLKERKIPSAITSSSPVERIREYLTPLGLYGSFDEILSGHDVPHGKPEPDIYQYGAASLGLRPEECLALEDAPAGILSAFRAGCLPVLIPDLDQPEEETRRLLYARADSLADIPGLIEKRNGHL